MLALAVAAGVVAACSSASENGGGFTASVGGTSGDTPGGGGTGSSGGGFSAGDDAGLPAEVKVENAYESPVATGQIVWIANPSSGRVAYIDAQTFAVQTVAAGNAPTYIAAVPDSSDDVAIVQNVLSQDATLFRVHQGQIASTTFPSTPDANSWAISPKGRWAIAWANAEFVEDALTTQGFQSVEVIDLSGQRAPIVLTVGYRPSQIAFSGDESRAYAVTQDGISVLDLTGQSVPTAIALYSLTAATSTPPPLEAGPEASTEDAALDAASADSAQTDADAGAQADALVAEDEDAAGGSSTTPDVSFTPDSAYALVRIDGSSSVTVVSMADGSSVAVELPSPPTDLTVSPTGTFAMAALRDVSAVAVLPLPGVFADPTSFKTISIPNQVIGRVIVTQSGQSALLFTTAAPVDGLTVLTLGTTPSYRQVTLHAPVLAVFPTADGKNAIVLHQTSSSLGSSAGAFSIVPVTESLPALIQPVAAPPTAVAIAPTSDYALVSVRDDSTSQYGIYLGLMPSLEVIPYTLASPPIAVGIAAGAGRGYAAQDYAEGRITFVDFASAANCDASSCSSSRTISGFELNAGIVNGGAQ